MSLRKLRRSVARAEAIRKGTGVLVVYRPRGPSKRGGWMVPPSSGRVNYHLTRKKKQPAAATEVRGAS